MSSDVRRTTIEDAVGRLQIDIEKLLCAKLGRPWQPSGFSIESLIDELVRTRPPEVTHGAAIGGDVVTDAELQAACEEFLSHKEGPHSNPSRNAMRSVLNAFIRAHATASTRPDGGDVGRDAK